MNTRLRSSSFHLATSGRLQLAKTSQKVQVSSSSLLLLSEESMHSLLSKQQMVGEVCSYILLEPHLACANHHPIALAS